MPKNKGAGGKNRRKGKPADNKPKELIFKEDGQEYGQVTRSVGNGFMDVLCFTDNGNILRRAHIRGSMRKKIWMATGDIVLVSTRGFQDNTCDIILKYTSDQARTLRARQQLPENIDINKKDTVADEQVFSFDDDESDNGSEENPNRKVSKQTRNLDMPPSDSDDD